MKKKIPYSFPLLFFLTAFFYAGCEKEPLKEAFKGNYSIGRNNKIINEYCQSCHVHAIFVPDNHINKMNGLYTKRLFQTTNECRTCHYLKKNLLGDTLRRHRRPRLVAKGMYREFIKGEWKRKAAKKREAARE